MTASHLLRIRRNLTGEHALSGGEYTTIPNEHITRMMITVVICCPLCSAKSKLTDAFIISRRDGLVTPAFQCPKCPLLERLVLDGWAEVPK